MHFAANVGVNRPKGFDSRTAHMRHRHALHDFAPNGAVVGKPAQYALKDSLRSRSGDGREAS